MSTIKTGEWLKQALKNENMTQRDLANKCGLSIPAIAKIISGERLGSPGTWDKINSVLNTGAGLSYESSEFINEIKEEISLYGCNKECIVFYKEEYGNLIFFEYALDEDMSNHDFNKKDLNKYNSLRTKLKDALELFEHQNRIV